ncbi:hypothetical protein D3C83_71550 [compost metagenome]
MGASQAVYPAAGAGLPNRKLPDIAADFPPPHPAAAGSGCSGHQLPEDPPPPDEPPPPENPPLELPELQELPELRLDPPTVNPPTVAKPFFLMSSVALR